MSNSSILKWPIWQLRDAVKTRKLRMMETEEIKDILQVLTERVRARRNALGLTQDQLAERAGLSTNYIARLEIGLRTPSMATLKSLARALDVQIADLLAEESGKWLDEAQKLAYILRSLPDEESKFLLQQFYTNVEFIRRHCK